MFKKGLETGLYAPFRPGAVKNAGPVVRPCEWPPNGRRPVTASTEQRSARDDHDAVKLTV